MGQYNESALDLAASALARGRKRTNIVGSRQFPDARCAPASTPGLAPSLRWTASDSEAILKLLRKSVPFIDGQRRGSRNSRSGAVSTLSTVQLRAFFLAFLLASLPARALAQTFPQGGSDPGSLQPESAAGSTLPPQGQYQSPAPAIYPPTGPAGYQPQPSTPYTPPAQLGTIAGMVVTTTFNIEGYRIREYRGVVRGVVVRQPTIGQGFRAGFQGILGGRIPAYAQMCDQARQQAFDLLVQHALALGANAVVGFRYDSSSFSGQEFGTEVLCYGTAVVIEPAR